MAEADNTPTPADPVVTSDPTTAAPQGLRNGRVPAPEAEAVDAFILEFDITFNEFGSMRVTWAGKGNACKVDKLVLYQSREFGKNVYLALVDARELELRRGCSAAVTIDGRRTTDTPVVGLTENGLYVYFERTRPGVNVRVELVIYCPKQ